MKHYVHSNDRYMIRLYNSLYILTGIMNITHHRLVVNYVTGNVQIDYFMAHFGLFRMYFIFFNSQNKWNKNLFKKMHIIFMRSWNRNGKRFGSCVSLFSKNNKFPCYQRSTQLIYMHFCCINHCNHLVWYDIHTREYEGRWFFLHLNNDKDRFSPKLKLHHGELGSYCLLRVLLFLSFLLSQIYYLLYVGFYIRFYDAFLIYWNFSKLTETFPSQTIKGYRLFRSKKCYFHFFVKKILFLLFSRWKSKKNAFILSMNWELPKFTRRLFQIALIFSS